MFKPGTLFIALGALGEVDKKTNIFSSILSQIPFI